MRQMTREWAQRLYLADALEILDENPQSALLEGINLSQKIRSLRDHKHARKRLNLKHTSFEVELISFWMMNQIDEDYGAVLCSSTGNLLKANHPILFHPDQFFYFRLSFPLRGMGEPITIFREYDDKRMSGGDLWSRYACIGGDTGIIKLKNQTRRLLIQHFGVFPDYESDGGIFDGYVKPFLGWCVVFDPDIFPESYFEIFESFGVLNKHWTKPEEILDQKPMPKKRGPKPAPAKQEFFKRYPNGLPEGLSADAVAAELTEIGFPISGRSVQNYDRDRRIKK